MKHLNIRLTGIVISVISYFPLKAQQNPPKKDSAATKPKTSHWEVGLAYLSNSTYLGRHDSLAVPYLTPSVAYHDKSGLFLSAAFSYLATGAGRIDVTTLEGGYGYESDHVNFEITAGRDFYNQESFAVNSGIKGRLSTYFSYDFDFIEPSLEFGADFTETTDFGATIGIEHTFTVIENRLEINPALKANASTQNFYNYYYKNRRYNPNRGGSKNGVTSASDADASRFGIMDYELNTAIEYKFWKKWKLGFTPTVAFPVNPSTVTITTKNPTGSGYTTTTSTETLNTVFFWTVGLTYTFGGKSK